MVSPDYSEKARIAKDVSAGAVLITAVGSVVIGYIILFPHLEKTFEEGMHVAKHSSGEIAVISLIVVVIAVVILKARYGKGHPLRGGMPSGHSALAFSLWFTISFMTESFLVSLISLILASMVAQSRVAVKIHTPLEVIIGALLGIGITLCFYIIFG
jgi:diacylglycerol kinase (ATP)